jgi:predicted transcriptional regulator
MAPSPASPSLSPKKHPAQQLHPQRHLHYIAVNPGVQFRAICGGLGLSIGVVQFHLMQLEKNGLIESLRWGRYKRFFVVGTFSRGRWQRLQRRGSKRFGVFFGRYWREEGVPLQTGLQVTLSSQALTWQMNRLQETGLIEETRDGLNVSYRIKPEQVELVTLAVESRKNKSKEKGEGGYLR